MIPYKLLRQTTFSLISLLLFPAMLAAQSEWVDYGQERSSLSIEIIKPVAYIDSTFKGEWYAGVAPDYTTLSGAIFLTGRHAVGKNFVLVADISFARGDLDDEGYEAQSVQMVIGNPYIGAEYHLPETPLFFELGMRIPIVSEDNTLARVVGYLSDFDRVEAFVPKIIPVFVDMNFEKIFKSNILLRAGTGISLWFNSKEIGAYRDPAIAFKYILQTGYNHPRVNIILGLIGRQELSSEPRIGEKFHEMQYGTTITIPFGNFRPGINFRIPGNSQTKKRFDYVFGLNLTYVFKENNRNKVE